MAGLLVVLLIVAVVVSLTLPSTPSTTTTTTTAGATVGSNQAISPLRTTTTTSAGSSVPSAAEVAACQSDALALSTALAAYQATRGSFPTPPAPWSAATYPTNFSPLTGAAAPGPFLKMPPSDNHYVLEYDASGHVWAESPGTFDAAYDANNDTTTPAACQRVTR
jgi:hypothetical protein